MKQPVNIKNTNISNNSKNRQKPKKIRTSDELDGSGLEAYFRINFLDKLGLEYIQQFKAESIGRFYDYLIVGKSLLIEVDGTYFHSDPRVYVKKNRMQKRNSRIDEVKNKWALINGFVLLRFWEHDIYNNPKMIFDELKKHLEIQTKKELLLESKKNGSFYKKKKLPNSYL